jgi:hypothetical protein
VRAASPVTRTEDPVAAATAQGNGHV